MGNERRELAMPISPASLAGALNMRSSGSSTRRSDQTHSLRAEVPAKSTTMKDSDSDEASLFFTLTSTRETALRELWFPFATTIDARRGMVSIVRAQGAYRCCPKPRVVVPAQVLFDIELQPDATGASELTLVVTVNAGAMSRGPEDQLRVAFLERPRGKYLSRYLAAAVFSNPDETWDLPKLRDLTGLDETQLRRRLFAESHSLTELVRRQRMQRALIDRFSI